MLSWPILVLPPINLWNLPTHIKYKRNENILPTSTNKYTVDIIEVHGIKLKYRKYNEVHKIK